MSASPYATNKLAWHPEVLEQLRQAAPTVPLIVQLMPTNVCNQACEFCLVAGTRIRTQRGEVPIETVTTADRVWDGLTWARVTQTGQRLASETVVLHTGIGRMLRLTPEHPVATKRGWILAGKVTTEDWLATALPLWAQPAKPLPGTSYDRVDSIDRMKAPVTVYNLACVPTERYFANDLLVHNCSYGSGPESVRATVENPARALWKNQQLYDTRQSLTREKLHETLGCLARMRTKCVEVTGGGEPTVYAHFDELVAAIGLSGLEFALVTNGTRITAERARAMGSLPFVWVRVSIDAGTEADYVRTRHVPAGHWVRAWEAVAHFAREKRQSYAHPESKVGVGFVVDRENWRGVYEACRLAKEAGADNIRISTSFTPDGVSRFDADCIASVPEQVRRAINTFADETFAINDLSGERMQNIVVGRQTYPFCAWKEIGCVVGADANVYSCCSLAYNRLGRMFSIAEQTFEAGWTGDGAKWRAAHDPRLGCKVQCLYEKRNLEALQLMGDPVLAAHVVARGEPPPHRNFV